MDDCGDVFYVWGIFARPRIWDFVWGFYRGQDQRRLSKNDRQEEVLTGK